jgi:hypothetical protein
VECVFAAQSNPDGGSGWWQGSNSDCCTEVLNLGNDIRMMAQISSCTFSDPDRETDLILTVAEIYFNSWWWPICKSWWPGSVFLMVADFADPDGDRFADPDGGRFADPDGGKDTEMGITSFSSARH